MHVYRAAHGGGLRCQAKTRSSMPMDLASALGILVVCSGLLSHAVITTRTTAIQTSTFIVNAETFNTRTRFASLRATISVGIL